MKVRHAAGGTRVSTRGDPVTLHHDVTYTDASAARIDMGVGGKGPVVMVDSKKIVVGAYSSTILVAVIEQHHLATTRRQHRCSDGHH